MSTIQEKLNHRYSENIEESYTLPSHFYTDSDIYNLEIENVFNKGWLYVCHKEKVAEPGQYMTFEIFNQNIFITKDKQHKINAFYNVCPHRGHELVQGEGKKSVITCPYHAWSFQLDGAFNNGRAVKQMKNFDEKEVCLKSIKVELFCNLIFINFDENAPSMQKLYPDLEKEIYERLPQVDSLTFSKRLSYNVKANWKNINDNYLECHHCAVAHPQFVQMIDMNNYQIQTFDNYIKQTGIGKKGYNNEVLAVEEKDVLQYNSYWLWPNVMIDIMPGEPGMIIMNIIPINEEECIEIFDFYFLNSEPTAEGWDNIEYQDKVLNIEDIVLVESVQRGLKSRGYTDGRYVVDEGRSCISEHGVHHFHGLVLKALECKKEQ
ncbi:aromatic ring-hydroxylating oxygenase subunit alpha [Bacillus massiliigorillae]|uniref:aromatic ring-hydroxylating oxygenase subunit alpha n=1 Tax=Bacillus massiliigorillae TaxID=1243664 RepID=UPI0003A59167|nr:aromatic ring-hydroxylating dioxygenase subunit alpha [Bacillus massiliigorillae]